MKHEMFWFVIGFIFSAMLALSLGDAQAQTAGRIAKFNEFGSPADSNITEDAAGNVGIGTTMPTDRLTVEGSGSIRARIRSVNGPAVLGLDSVNGDTRTWWALRSGDLGDGSFGFSINDLRDSEVSQRFTISTEGNIGIGKLPNPIVKLSLQFGDPTGFTTGRNALRAECSDFDCGGGVFLSSSSSGVAGASLNGVGTVGVTFNADSPGVLAVSAGQSPLNLALEVLGRIVATGRVQAEGYDTASSRRWKTSIQPIDGALDKVGRLRGVSFNWKESGKRDLGMIAEEVGEVVPEVVAYEANSKDAKSVDYARLTALLVEAVKEQQSQIRELKAEVEGLKAKLAGGKQVAMSASLPDVEPLPAAAPKN